MTFPFKGYIPIFCAPRRSRVTKFAEFQSGEIFHNISLAQAAEKKGMKRLPANMQYTEDVT